MAKMNTKAIQDAIRNSILEALKATLEELGAEQFANYSYALPVTVDGIERWGAIEIKSKYAGEKKPAFDPFEVAEEWRIDKEIKAHEKELKAKAKAEKIARDKAKRAETSEPTDSEPVTE